MTTIEYTKEYQISLISMLLSDPDAWNVCASQFKDQYFDDPLKPAVRYIANYQQKYHTMPSHEQIAANCFDMTIPKFSEPLCHTTAAIDDYETFIRFRAMENAILDGVDNLQKGSASIVLDQVRQAHELHLRASEHPFDGLWIDECASVEPPEYLIPNWLVRDTVTCVYGAPGAYKSFLCLEAGFCLAAGIPFAGRDVQQTSVAYVAAEGQRGIASRVEALCEFHSLRPQRNAFRLITQPLNLLDDDEVTKFINYLTDLERREAIDFGLVVLDTYSQCIAGADENSQAVASKASSNMIRIRRELETTVIYVHHTGKDAARGMRGSDALRANTDCAVEVIKDDDAKAATAHVRRSKDAPTGERIRFNMIFQKVAKFFGRELDGSLVPEFVKEEPIGTPMPNTGRVISWLEDLLRYMTEGQVVSVAQAVKMTGRHANTHYKDKLAELLPLGMAVDVRDMDGDVIGQIGRLAGSQTKNQHGDIKCLSKSAE